MTQTVSPLGRYGGWQGEGRSGKTLTRAWPGKGGEGGKGGAANNTDTVKVIWKC